LVQSIVRVPWKFKLFTGYRNWRNCFGPRVCVLYCPNTKSFFFFISVERTLPTEEPAATSVLLFPFASSWEQWSVSWTVLSAPWFYPLGSLTPWLLVSLLIAFFNSINCPRKTRSDLGFVAPESLKAGSAFVPQRLSNA